MTCAAWQNDLVVLAADKSIDMALQGLLGRTESLRIRSVVAKHLVHPKHDPGCARTPEAVLRPYVRDCHYALVVMDHEGSGFEGKGREELESQIEQLLAKNGWDSDRAAAVVIEPELENWVWSESPIVAECLGWEGRAVELRTRLEEIECWPQGETKPVRPKEAMRWVLRQVRKPWSSSIHGQLAQRVRFEGCTDPAFGKLCRTLRAWFGEGRH